MIAVALGLIGLVVMVTTGVAASSTADDHLAFLGVGVQTTTAQVFLTGAIFGWVFVIALWLLRVGIHRSGERCAQLAQRRGRRAGEWLGFGDGGGAEDDGWDEWGVSGRRPGADVRGTEADSIRFRTVHRIDAEVTPRDAGRRDGGWAERIVGRTGAAGDGRGAPWRPDGGADEANRAVAGAAEQPGPLGHGHPAGPVAGRFPGVGIRMNGGTERRQIGGGSGAVAGEDCGSEGEHRPGEGRQ